MAGWMTQMRRSEPRRRRQSTGARPRARTRAVLRSPPFGFKMAKRIRTMARMILIASVLGTTYAQTGYNQGFSPATAEELSTNLAEVDPRDNSGPELEFRYHDHEDMTRYLRAVSAKYPSLTALYSIGKSVQGRDLWVMVVSASPYEHMIGKPDVKYVANIHGNEAVGREMLLHLIHHLVTSYDTDAYVKWLLDNTRIHLMPSMNPDGYAISHEGECDTIRGRHNARRYDLNRNFPDYFKANTKQPQPETEAVKEWISKIQFVLSGSLHGGALVASYPFDNTPSAMFQSYAHSPSIAPDDDVFRHLSLVYSNNHAKMSRGVSCKSGSPRFPNGITNGAAWYPLTGGMQDYNYLWHGCMEITLEISCCKFPPSRELPKYWQDNKQSLIKYLAEAHRGAHGFVMDENGNPVERALVRVKGRDVTYHTTKYGEFWRILLPGTYRLDVSKQYFNTIPIVLLDHENGNPVERALVRVKGRDVTYHTTKYGEFWRILLPGTYRLDNGNPVERALVRVKGRDVTYHTTKYGEFWRILLPGTYRLDVSAEGYLPQEVEFIVIETHPTLLNVTLHSAKRIDGGPIVSNLFG
ncbi:zinc carboxypeptidase domain-containing protein [Phthorimaea operculella]|nr:zinc carboxypeptidase domain-containing protein [Phthorimaea operculella]